MKTKYRITKSNEAMTEMGYVYQIDFDITGKGTTPEQKNLNLGFTKTLVEAVDFAIEKMHDPIKDEIVIDHKSGQFGEGK